MYSKGTKDQAVLFSLKPAANVKKAALAGDFNDWKPLAMRKQKNGLYSVSIKLAPGAHEYKFIVNDEWIVDPDNNAWAMNPFGTLNSVAHVE